MKALKTTSLLFALLVAAGVTGCGRTGITAEDVGGGTGKLTVTVKDEQGPVAGSNVEVLTADGQSAGTGAQSNDQGIASFTTLPVGEGYTVKAEHDGAIGKTTVSIRKDRDEAVTVQLKVSSAPGGVIAGTVKVAGTDRPLPGAKIEVVGQKVSATTDETGHYKLEDVPAGQQQIKASYAGYHDSARDLAVKAGTSNTLVIELSPQSAGARAQHTVITTMKSVVEVDQYHNPITTTKTSEAWSAMVNRSTGNMLIADAGKNAAFENAERGTTLKTFSGTSAWKLGFGGIKAPRGASYTPSNTVLVADTGNSRIVEIDGNGSRIGELKASLKAPRWAERQRTGTTLVADTGNNRLVELSSSGSPVWGLGDGSTNILNHPTHAMRLPDGNTLVTDAGNSRVMEVNSQGKLVWMIGDSRPVAGEGPNLNNPNSAVRLPSGNTLIADTGNNRVIEVDAKNTIVWQMSAPSPLFADRL